MRYLAYKCSAHMIIRNTCLLVKLIIGRPSVQI